MASKLKKTVRSRQAPFSQIFMGRNEERTLKERVFPSLYEHAQTGKPLRVWMPECGTGETLYILGIFWHEFCEEKGMPADIEFFGTDRKPLFVKCAREGTFARERFRLIGDRRIKAFFTRSGANKIQIRPFIRYKSIFATHDLIKDPPLVATDLIVIENLTFMPQDWLAKNVMPLFHHALKPTGLMMIVASHNAGEFAGFKKAPDHPGLYMKTERLPARREFFRTLTPFYTKAWEEENHGSQRSEASRKSLLKHQDPQELIVRNEELIIRIEELESTNEQLRMVREELKSQLHEIAQRHDHMEESVNAFITLLGMINLPFVVIDRKMRIQRFSPSGARLFNLIDDDVGRPFSDIRSNLELENLVEKVRHTFQSGQTQDIEVRERSGAWHLLKIAPTASQDRKTSSVIVSLVSINLLKEREAALVSDKAALQGTIQEQAKQLQKARRLSEIGTLAATVAHELRNPLAVINLSTHSLGKKMENDRLTPYVEDIQKNVVRSNRIINNLLNYAHIKMPHYEPIKLYETLRKCAEDTQKKYTEKEIAVSAEIEEIRNVTIEADPFQLDEILSNILNNACEAVKAKSGRIKLSASKSGAKPGMIKIVIEDNGPGVPKEHMDKIFKPFFTLKSKGTGLGLTIVHQMVGLHDGKMEFKTSEKGTIVTILLPAKKPNGEPMAREPHAPALTHGEQ